MMHNMRLIQRTVRENEESSKPEFEVTLRVPVDPLVNDIARNESLYAEWGEKFIDVILAKENEENQ
jgi:hypothetical protein